MLWGRWCLYGCLMGVLSLSAALYSVNCAIYAIQGLALVMVWFARLVGVGRGAIKYRSFYSFGDMSLP